MAVQTLRGQLRGAKSSFPPFRNTPFRVYSFYISYHFCLFIHLLCLIRIRILDCRYIPGYATKAVQLVLASQYKISKYKDSANVYYKWNRNTILVVILYCIVPGGAQSRGAAPPSQSSVIVHSYRTAVLVKSDVLSSLPHLVFLFLLG